MEKGIRIVDESDRIPTVEVTICDWLHRGAVVNTDLIHTGLQPGGGLQKDTGKPFKRFPLK